MSSILTREALQASSSSSRLSPGRRACEEMGGCSDFFLTRDRPIRHVGPAFPTRCDHFVLSANAVHVDDSLLCCIRLGVLYDPLQHKACGNCVCRGCLADAGWKCPAKAIAGWPCMGCDRAIISHMHDQSCWLVEEM